MVVLAACAGPTPFPVSPASPGWSEVVDEPAGSSFGEVLLAWTEVPLERCGTQLALSGDVRVSDIPADQRLYFAMRWNHESPVVVSDLLPLSPTGVRGEHFSLLLAPPQSALEPFSGRTCSGTQARGVLLAYLTSSDTPHPETDELVGVSSKDPSVFSSLQRGYDQLLTWSSCPFSRPLMPLQLQHDERLRLTLCDTTCTQPVFDRTRIAGASLSLGPAGWTLNATFVNAGYQAASYEINGLATEGSGSELAPWHEGPNVVRVQVDDLPAWEAVLTLPALALSPRLAEPTLQVGAPFSLSWDASPWATNAFVQFRPLEVPILKVGDPFFTTNQTSFTETFPGFHDAGGALREVPRAGVSLEVRQLQNRYGFSLSEEFEVPVAR
jgi:hypothetical protein